MISIVSSNSSVQMKQQNTLADLARRFAEYLDVSELTVKSYKSGVRKFLEFLHSNGISNPTRDTVILYKKELMTRYSANTVSLYLSAIRRFFSWCDSEKLYPNICTGIKSPKISREHKRDAFSAGELKTIISGLERNNLEGMRNYAMFTLIATCGLRTCEVVRANIGDIHRVAGATILDIQGKGHISKDAFVKLTPNIEKAIREYLKARGNVSEDEPLFASCSRRNYGQRLTTVTVSQVCKRAMVSAGFDSHRLTAHSLRHSAVTICLLGGMSLSEVQVFARHQSISTTMIYNHSVNRMKSLCEATIASAIFS